MPRRLLQLYLGLVAYGLSMLMMMRSGLGLMPWDVLHQGLALHSGWPMGRVAVAVSFAVLLAWIPIRQKPGLGTISNALVIGLVFDAADGLIGDAFAGLPLGGRIALLTGGIALNAAATAAYIGAHFGPGPRDGLMTGLVRRTGRSVRLIRTLIEGGAGRRFRPRRHPRAGHGRLHAGDRAADPDDAATVRPGGPRRETAPDGTGPRGAGLTRPARRLSG